MNIEIINIVSISSMDLQVTYNHSFYGEKDCIVWQDGMGNYTHNGEDYYQNARDCVLAYEVELMINQR